MFVHLLDERQALITKESLAWHHRPRSPGLKWHKEYDTPESLKHGRVLLIDYVKQGVGI